MLQTLSEFMNNFSLPSSLGDAKNRFDRNLNNIQGGVQNFQKSLEQVSSNPIDRGYQTVSRALPYLGAQAVDSTINTVKRVTNPQYAQQSYDKHPVASGVEDAGNLLPLAAPLLKGLPLVAGIAVGPKARNFSKLKQFMTSNLDGVESRLLSDAEAFLRPGYEKLIEKGARVGDIFSHDKLFQDAYPELKNYTVVRGKVPDSGAEIDTGIGKITLNSIPENHLYEQSFQDRGNLIHELQHSVQDVEGMVTGANTRSALNNMTTEELAKALMGNKKTTVSEMNTIQYYKDGLITQNELFDIIGKRVTKNDLLNKYINNSGEAFANAADLNSYTPQNMLDKLTPAQYFKVFMRNPRFGTYPAWGKPSKTGRFMDELNMRTGPIDMKEAMIGAKGRLMDKTFGENY